MRNLNVLFLLTSLLILSISLIAYYNKSYSDIAIVKSSLDQNEYLVRKVDTSCMYTPKEAANILAQLRAKALDFINILNSNSANTSKSDDRHETKERNQLEVEDRLFIERLTNNFRPNALSESSSYQTGTSYSLNKGEKIVLCLRQKPDNSFVDMNTLSYVLLHELTHLGTIEDYPHSQIFDRNFKFALKNAVDHNLYVYEPYHERPIPYCGKMITDTPLRIK